MANQTFAFQQTAEREYPFGYKAHPEDFNLMSRAFELDEILPMAGLDWEVEEEPIENKYGIITTHKSIVRSDTHENIGIVGSGYVSTQHRESVGMIADFLGDDAKFAGGGSFRGGASVWLQAHMTEGYKILDDDMEDFLVVYDTHDGSGSFAIYITSYRIWCKNVINPSLRKAKRKVLLRHTRNIMSRMDEVREVLFEVSKYRVELADFADVMVHKKVSDNEVKTMLNSLFPVTDKATDLVKRNAEEKKEAFYVCYAAPDIAKFQGTAWGIIQATSDLVCHSMPHKNTQDWNDNQWAKIMAGHPVFDKVVKYLA